MTKVLSSCAPQPLSERMGGAPTVATVDESSGTVYVTNNLGGTVSLFQSSH